MRENKHRSHNNFYSDRDQESSSMPTELIRKEQDYRHQWQDKYLRSNIFSFRLGQAFGLIYNLALLCLVYDLIQDGEKGLALKIFALNAAIIAFALLVTSIERRVLSKKPPRRMRNDKRPAARNYNNRSRDIRDNKKTENR
jgi:hypothetical protein